MIQRPESWIVESVSRIVTPFVQMFGLYVIIHGHNTPGGGFQGGVILGASYILLAIACGLEEMKRRFPLWALTLCTSAGVFLYGGIGLLCLLSGGNFLNYGVLPVPEPRAVGMLGIEIGVGMTVMAVIISIFRDLMEFE